MAMSTQELLAIVAPSAAGLMGGIASGNQAKQQQQQSMQDQFLNQLFQQMQMEQGLQQNRQGMSQQTVNARPLGQEQQFLQRQRAMSALLPQIQKFQMGRPTDPGIAGSYVPPTQMAQGLAGDKGLQQSFSDPVTAQSLADRRSDIAQMNPQARFSSLGNMGLDPGYDQQVSDSQIDSMARLQSFETTQRDLMNKQIQTTQQQMQQQQQSGGGGVKGFLGGVLKAASPFASLIPGVGPIAGMAMAAGGSALGSKLQGQSNMQALGSGLLGAGGALGTEALQRGGNPFGSRGPTLNNAMTSASLPQMGVGAGGPGPQLQLPNNMSQQFTPFRQGGSQQAPNLPIFNRANPQGGSPRPSMPQPSIPFALGHGSQGSQGAPAPASTNIFGQTRSPQLQQVIDQVLNSGLGKGYTGGGLNMGMLPGMQAVTKLPQLLNGGPNLGGIKNVTPLGPGPRPSGLLGQGQRQLGDGGMNNQINAQKILEILSGNNGMSTADKAKFLADPMAQTILKNLK